MDDDVIYSVRGPTDTTIWASRDQDGDLVITGQDLGDAPLRFFGESEYEYGITVAAEHAEAITVDLLRSLAHRPPGGTTPIVEWLRERSIPFEFWNRF